MSERTMLHGFPVVTAQEMRDIEGRAIEEYGITREEMIELVAARLASLTGEILGLPDLSDRLRPILVVVGQEECGVTGLVAARHLANRGLEPHVALAIAASELGDLARARLHTLEKMGVHVLTIDPSVEELGLVGEDHPSVLVDALTGYCHDGPIDEANARVIKWMNNAGAPILSLDVPSGLDATTGERAARCVKAHTTMTLALPKKGLLEAGARKMVGRLILTDMGLPHQLYEDFGLQVTGRFPPGGRLSLLA
jgi:hydroxyethylthiazole kinase-like uncharacterized protein yjeF